MRFNKSLAVVGALGLAVLTAGPALAEPVPADQSSTLAETTAPVEEQTTAPETAQPEIEKPEVEPTPESKPAPTPSETATPKPTETKPAEESAKPEITGVTVTPGTVKPGQAYTVNVTTRGVADGKRVHVQKFGAPALSYVKDGRASVKLVAPADATPGVKPLTVSVQDAGRTEASVTVEAEEAKPVDPRFGLSSYQTTPGGEITADVVGDIRAGEVIFSSDLFGTKTMPLKDIGDGLGRATMEFVVPADAKDGVYQVRADLGRFGKPTADLTVKAAPVTAYGISVSPSAVEAGQRVTYTVTGKAADAFIESPAFWSKINENMTGTETKTGTVPTDPSAKPGTYPVNVVFKDANGRTVGTARTSVTIKGEIKPIVGMDLSVSPAKVQPGGSYIAGVTTANVKPGTKVVITSPDGKKHTVTVDDRGVAGVRLYVPKHASPGVYKVVAALPSGQSSTATLTVAKHVTPAVDLFLRLSPHTVYAGQSFTAFVSTRDAKPGTPVTIKDPGGRHFTVKIDAHGVASVRFHVPSSTKPGKYGVSADMKHAKKAWATLTVKVSKAPTGDLTPKGGAQTGGGLAAESSNLTGVALGGLLIAGGAGAALSGRRRSDQV